MSTKLRDHALSTAYSILHEGLKRIHDNPATQSCLTCAYFIEKNETCQKYQARPPARVIAYSCESYVDNDDIPF
jgi:hypothetical protein